MNKARSEMLHCLNTLTPAATITGAEISVFERQRTRMKHLEQENLHAPFMNSNDQFISQNLFPVHSLPQFQGLVNNDDPAAVVSGLTGHLMNRTVKPDPSDESSLTNYGFSFGAGGFGNGSVYDMNYQLPRTASCPQAVAEGVDVDNNNKGRHNLSSTMGTESFKKRKSDSKTQNLKVIEEEHRKDKKIKVPPEEEESKITERISSSNKSAGTNKNNSKNSSKETSVDTSKENSKVSDVQKPDYIHVRARRGQATDSHSLAERVRREKISERMKYLQDLVPGCNKITGKAGMLDEIINYVQSLQKQVEFLSMKLATVNPTLDLGNDNFFNKEMLTPSTSNFPIIEGSSEVAYSNSYLQFNPLQQMVPCCGQDVGMDTIDMGLRRTISAPISFPETFLDSPCLNPQQFQASSTWDAELSNLYGMEFQQGRSTPLLGQQFQGSIEAGNLKMEM